MQSPLLILLCPLALLLSSVCIQHMHFRSVPLPFYLDGGTDSFRNQHIHLKTPSAISYFLILILALVAWSKVFLLQVSSGDRDQRMKEALGTMGASVFRFFALSSPES